MSEIYGRNPVIEALKSGTEINRVYIAKGAQHKAIDEIYKLARAAQVPVQQVERRKLDSLFPGKNHQGVYASVAEMQYVEWEDILAQAREKGEPPLVLVLDEIEDPHNLGAILRNADAFGVHGVIIPKRRSVSLTGTVAKAAAGALQYVPVARVANIAQTLKALKKEGLWVCGTAMDGQNIYQAPLSGALAIVIGNEGHGMRPLVAQQCDFTVAIPMKGRINSLNASVATGIVLSEVERRREG
ncbi:MAG: 23S rRNA (guanosine(2251)-2'-O)-methyltransferase RlmB [Peptococcaceae bacterium]|nr:23S rRNA (guanosine(2251)-2'-O)-methyltransferase RlmB [Peptococcaceae bacterium]